MASFLIPAAVSLLGGLFGKKDERNQAQDANRFAKEQRAAQDARDEAAQRARFNMGRGGFERNEAARAIGGSAGGDLLSKYFKNLDPALLQQVRTQTPYPDFEFQPGGAAPLEQPVPGFSGFAGGLLSGIAPYIGLNEQSQSSPYQEYLDRVEGGKNFMGPPSSLLGPGYEDIIDPISPNGNKVVGR